MRRNFNAEKDAWEDQNKHLEVEANRWGVVGCGGVVWCGVVWWGVVVWWRLFKVLRGHRNNNSLP